MRLATAMIGEMAESFSAGQSMAQALLGEGLTHVLVFSDGLSVNGSELVRGFRSVLPAGVELTGGLAGDGERFQRTLVFADAPASERTLVAVGFYGARLAVGYGSVGGWDTFGPERLITRSAGNVLFDLDGKPALELYKRYLGEHAAGLPATGLLFPLLLRSESGSVVRTILGVNEAEQSMTFAGDMPEGQHARLMKANFDRLVDGAVAAAEVSLQGQGGTIRAADQLCRAKAGAQAANRRGGAGHPADIGEPVAVCRFLFLWGDISASQRYALSIAQPDDEHHYAR